VRAEAERQVAGVAARETAEWRPGYVLRGLVSLPLKL